MSDIERSVREIEQMMAPVLDNAQMKRLQAVLRRCLFDLSGFEDDASMPDNENCLQNFLSTKRLEGCSGRTIDYYKHTLSRALCVIGKPLASVTTDDVRRYLSEHQQNTNASSVTIDNMRRILSSFFSWLEDESLIMKSPVRRIKKIKSCKPVKEIYSDEDLERMRDSCGNPRDLAIIDLLASTGMRVGELVTLERTGIDFERRECIVVGKGQKERVVYFDARTKVHLAEYLSERTDANSALFVSLNAPYSRLQISGVETMLRKLGTRLSMQKVHPHKFRRTLATSAIDKGMPIEQVQVLLGHQSIDTTLQYAMVEQRNVKSSHRRYIS